MNHLIRYHHTVTVQARWHIYRKRDNYLYMGLSIALRTNLHRCDSTPLAEWSIYPEYIFHIPIYILIWPNQYIYRQPIGAGTSASFGTSRDQLTYSQFSITVVYRDKTVLILPYTVLTSMSSNNCDITLTDIHRKRCFPTHLHIC